MLNKSCNEIYTVGQLKKVLSLVDDDMKVVLFANGEEYPLLQTQLVNSEFNKTKQTVLEVAGGWDSIDDFEMEVNYPR